MKHSRKSKQGEKTLTSVLEGRLVRYMWVVEHATSPTILDNYTRKAQEVVRELENLQKGTGS